VAVKFKETDRIPESPFLGTKIAMRIIRIAKAIMERATRKTRLPQGEYQRNPMKMTMMMMMKMSYRKSKKKE